MSKVAIVIKGNNAGFRGMYASPGLSGEDRLAIVYDLGSSNPSENGIGYECYSISFSPNGKVFSIYRVMYDVKRDGMAVGFLGVSLFVPFNLTINGNTVKTLLDRLMKDCRRFTPDDRLGIRNIEWDYSFAEQRLDEYNASFQRDSYVNSLVNPGSKDAAYIYYDEEQLPAYFEHVYQIQFQDYKEVLLVDKNQKYTNNVLSALKHSDDITDLVDLDNPPYRLVIIQSPGTEVAVKDGGIVDGQQINKSDRVKIDFSRKYYEPMQLEGFWDRLHTDNSSIISINDYTKTITVKVPQLEPLQRKVRIRLTDKDGNAIDSRDVSATCLLSRSRNSINVSDDLRIIFRGEEIAENFVIEIFGKGKYQNEKKEESGIDSILALTNINIEYLIYIHLKKIPGKKSNSGVSSSNQSTNIHNDGKEHYNPEKLSWWQINRSKVFVSAAIMILLFATAFVIKIFFGSSTSEVSTINQELFNKISDYSAGDVLFLDTLKAYKDILKTDDREELRPTKIAIENAIILRRAVDMGTQEDIAKARKMLPPDSRHLDFLAQLIQDTNFSFLVKIRNRSEMTLPQIQDSLLSLKALALKQTEEKSMAEAKKLADEKRERERKEKEQKKLRDEFNQQEELKRQQEAQRKLEEQRKLDASKRNGNGSGNNAPSNEDGVKKTMTNKEFWEWAQTLGRTDKQKVKDALEDKSPKWTAEQKVWLQNIHNKWGKFMANKDNYPAWGALEIYATGKLLE